MKAIIVKFLGPTDTKPARWKASDEDGNSLTISHCNESSGEAAAMVAAVKLCIKMDWHGTLKGGSLKNGYVFVFDSPDHSWVC